MIDLAPAPTVTEEFVSDYTIVEGMQRAFTFFNKELFEDRLPPAVITLQRKRNARGYFLNDAFAYRKAKIVTAGEIAMNPDTFIDYTDKEILSVLVHEMVHHWQRVWHTW